MEARERQIRVENNRHKASKEKQAKRLMQAIKTTRALVATESQRLKKSQQGHPHILAPAVPIALYSGAGGPNQQQSHP